MKQISLAFPRVWSSRHPCFLKSPSEYLDTPCLCPDKFLTGLRRSKMNLHACNRNWSRSRRVPTVNFLLPRSETMIPSRVDLVRTYLPKFTRPRTLLTPAVWTGFYEGRIPLSECGQVGLSLDYRQCRPSSLYRTCPCFLHGPN